MTTDNDRTAERDFAVNLFSHPEPDQSTEPDPPATSGNHVAREGRDTGTPIPYNDARQVARDLFSN